MTPGTRVTLMTYLFRITLISTSYDFDEREVEVIHGQRRFVGTEDDAIAFAKRTRTNASTARIERVATADGITFRPHEVRTFSVGI